jgi:hypothetical protein
MADRLGDRGLFALLRRRVVPKLRYTPDGWPSSNDTSLGAQLARYYRCSRQYLAAAPLGPQSYEKLTSGLALATIALVLRATFDSLSSA